MAELARVEAAMPRRTRPSSRTGNPRPRAAPPSRAETNQIRRMVRDNAAALEKLREEQHIQFQRIAQLQADVDALKKLLLEKTRHLP